MGTEAALAEWLFVFNSAAVRMNQANRSAAIVPQRFDHPPSRLERTYSPVKIKSRCSQPGRRRRAGCPRTGSPARLATALVTFEPGARTTWHTHPIGQTLTSSRASAGCRSRAARCAPATRSGLRPARSIGHGAAPTTAMVRLAMQEALDGKQIDRLEHVTQELYRAESG